MIQYTYKIAVFIRHVWHTVNLPGNLCFCLKLNRRIKYFYVFTKCVSPVHNILSLLPVVVFNLYEGSFVY